MRPCDQAVCSVSRLLDRERQRREVMLAITLLPEHAEPDRRPASAEHDIEPLKGNPMIRDPVSGREIVRGGHVRLPRCRPGEQTMHSGSMEVSAAKPGWSHDLH